MSLSEFKNGINLFDKIIMEISNLHKFTTFQDVTFLYFNCKSLEKLEVIRSHPLTKNVIVVSDTKFSRNNVITLSEKTWSENKEKLLELTKNSIVINENQELALEETYSFLGMCSQYYPIVLIFNKNKIKKVETKKLGFSSHIKEEISCNINVKLKDFQKYHVEDYEIIERMVREEESLLSLSKETPEKLNLDKGEVDLNLKKSMASPKRFDNTSTEEEFTFLNGVYSPKVKNVLDKYNVPSSKKWRQEFYEYLKDLLLRIFPEDKKKLVDVVLNNETLKEKWIPCFTHFTANPNPGKNYEAVETIGDVTMGYCFKFYIAQKEPLADQARISNLNQKYMSKIFQSKVAKKMKLQEWLISCGINADRMDNNEDLLESFCGTIDQILYEKSGKMGLGVIIIYNFLSLLFKNIKFEKEEKTNTDPDRTFVDQLFSGQVFRQPVKFHYTLIKRPKEIPESTWEKIVKDMNKNFLEPEGIHPAIIKRDTTDHPGIVNESTVSKTGKVTVKISILKEYAVIARRLGIDIPPREILIGESTRAIKKIAEKEAYTQAKEYVVSKGMTKEWKENLKKKNKILVLENIDEALEKAKTRFPEIVSISIERPKTMKVNGVDCVVYQIVGEDKDGKKISIFTLPSQEKAYEQEVINEYLID